MNPIYRITCLFVVMAILCFFAYRKPARIIITSENVSMITMGRNFVKGNENLLPLSQEDSAYIISAINDSKPRSYYLKLLTHGFFPQKLTVHLKNSEKIELFIGKTEFKTVNEDYYDLPGNTRAWIAGKIHSGEYESQKKPDTEQEPTEDTEE